MTSRTSHILLFVTLLSCGAYGDNWPNWRGPHQNGVADGTGYPTAWDETTNIAWRVEVPAYSGSTPIVWDDLIFLTAPDGLSHPDTDQFAHNAIYCFRRDGQSVWRRAFDDERFAKSNKASGSNSSPVTDGQYVFCYFKSGELACLDFAGNVLWQKNLQREFAEDTLWWDLGTSPVLTDSAVVVACVQSGPSYLVAFEKGSGDMLWKHDRMLDAPSESNQTYSTPIVLGDGADQRLIVLGADHVTAHDAQSGREIWRLGGLNPKGDPYFRSIASPVVSGSLVIAPYARGQSLTAVRLGGQGDVTATRVPWTYTKLSSDVPSPAACDGVVYLLTDRGVLAAFDAESGTVLRQKALPKGHGTFSASPIVADGKIYTLREDGTCIVLDAGDFRVLAENPLDGQTVSTPVLVDGMVLIRSGNHLTCIRDQASRGQESPRP